jgi:hypothetical protein
MEISRMRLAIILLALPLLAEDAKAPEISTQQQLDYRRAQVNLLNAQAEYRDVVTSMEKTCVPRPVITDAKGDPVCSKEVPK